MSNEGLEDAICDSESIRASLGIDPARKRATGATKLLALHRAPEQTKLIASLLDKSDSHLIERGLLMHQYMLVHAANIEMLPSIRNRARPQYS